MGNYEMKAIKTTATVTADSQITLTLPSTIPAGEYQVVLVIDEQPVTEKKRSPLRFAAYPVGLVSESFTFRREDLYANDW